MTVVGTIATRTIVVESTGCRATLRFTRDDGGGDDCGGDNRLPRPSSSQ